MSTPTLTTATFTSVIATTEITVTFGAGATTSSILDCVGMQPRALIIPSTWQSCNLNVWVARALNDPNNPDILQPMYNPDGSGIFVIATIASTSYPLIPWYFDAFRYVKLVSSVPQTSATIVTVAPMPLYQGHHV